ncbi:hypothetical protein D9611_008240 [Ephemerocybe angulata]|uniref:F-box domain-containing protein n=1 Tax=Ephemerocybe angulata TaxID=980116 RepID=A0A8H5BIF8_9AGAR|nr:hypothetical protein D9611_008240 [Tulosesus angulatus]
MATSINEKLPIDALQEIFSWAVFLDHTTSVRSRSVVRNNRAPFLLSRVCSHWRAITINTPSLWANLEIETYRLLHTSSAMDIYNLWLDRSSPHSLSIFISEDYYSSPRLLDNEIIINFLADCVTRCRYLHLSGPRVCCGIPKQLACRESTVYPNLQGLFLSSGCFHALKLEGTLTSIRFPNLRQLGISGADTAGTEHLLQLYNPNITHLSCEGHFFERLRLDRPMEDFANLVELDVLLLWSKERATAHAPSPSSAEATYRLAFPRLRILTVSENFQLDQTASFLTCISTPSLAVLKITGDPLIPCDFLESSHDFTFLEDFVAQAPFLERLELTHNLFHCDTFFSPKSRLHAIPFVQLSVTVRIRPWADCWTYHGEGYKKKGLDVVYEMSQGETGLAQFFLTMLVGWAKAKGVEGKADEGVGLGKRDVSTWKTSFWAGEAGKDYRKRRNQTLVKF